MRTIGIITETLVIHEQADRECCELVVVDSMRERKRLLETWYYNHRGLPRTGRNRFRLIGELQDKPRPAMGAMSGTLALDSGD